MASPAGEFSGKRRWWFATDTTFYTFDEFLAYCEKEQFMKYEPELKEKTIRGGAIHLWNSAHDKIFEDQLERCRAEQVSQLLPLPFKAFTTGSSIAVVLQNVIAPPERLQGPATGGGTLRINKHGLVDCWGMTGQRAVLRVEVLQVAPMVVARIYSFTGMCLRTAGEGNVRWNWGADGGEDTDDEQSSLFELRPQAIIGAHGEKPLTVIDLIPKGGAAPIGSFAVYAAPASLHNVDLQMPLQQLQHICQCAKDLAQADPEFQGRRRHKQDIRMEYYNFEELTCWAAQKFGCAGHDALQLGCVVWKFMCVEKESENNKAKRRRVGMLDKSL
jgi:hypothetical protein